MPCQLQRPVVWLHLQCLSSTYMYTQDCVSSEVAAVEGACPREAQKRGGQKAGLPHQHKGLRGPQRRAAEHCAEAAASVQPV